MVQPTALVQEHAQTHRHTPPDAAQDQCFAIQRQSCAHLDATLATRQPGIGQVPRRGGDPGRWTVVSALRLLLSSSGVSFKLPMTGGKPHTNQWFKHVTIRRQKKYVVTFTPNGSCQCIPIGEMQSRCVALRQFGDTTGLLCRSSTLDMGCRPQDGNFE